MNKLTLHNGAGGQCVTPIESLLLETHNTFAYMWEPSLLTRKVAGQQLASQVQYPGIVLPTAIPPVLF